MTAKIIAMEGVDSVGKETQTRLLKERLERNGFTVSTFTFPKYESPTGKVVKDYLMGHFGDPGSIPPELASALYSQDRSAMCKEIQDAVTLDHVIIMDRYVYSNLAFQGGKIDDINARKVFFEKQLDIEFNGLGLPKPDLTLFLDATPEKTRQLIKKRAGGMDGHEVNMALLNNAYHSYKLLSEQEGIKETWVDIAVGFNGNKFVGVDGIRPIEAIANDIYDTVLTVL